MIMRARLERVFVRTNLMVIPLRLLRIDALVCRARARAPPGNPHFL